VIRTAKKHLMLLYRHLLELENFQVSEKGHSAILVKQIFQIGAV
jgi:hypothetical protein